MRTLEKKVIKAPEKETEKETEKENGKKPAPVTSDVAFPGLHSHAAYIHCKAFLDIQSLNQHH